MVLGAEPINGLRQSEKEYHRMIKDGVRSMTYQWFEMVWEVGQQNGLRWGEEQDQPMVWNGARSRINQWFQKVREAESTNNKMVWEAGPQGLRWFEKQDQPMVWNGVRSRTIWWFEMVWRGTNQWFQVVEGAGSTNSDMAWRAGPADIWHQHLLFWYRKNM